MVSALLALKRPPRLVEYSNKEQTLVQSSTKTIQKIEDILLNNPNFICSVRSRGHTLLALALVHSAPLAVIKIIVKSDPTEVKVKGKSSGVNLLPIQIALKAKASDDVVVFLHNCYDCTHRPVADGTYSLWRMAIIGKYSLEIIRLFETPNVVIESGVLADALRSELPQSTMLYVVNLCSSQASHKERDGYPLLLAVKTSQSNVLLLSVI